MRAILWISYPKDKGFVQLEGCDGGDCCEIQCFEAKHPFEEVFGAVLVGIFLFAFIIKVLRKVDYY